MSFGNLIHKLTKNNNKNYELQLEFLQAFFIILEVYLTLKTVFHPISLTTGTLLAVRLFFSWCLGTEFNTLHHLYYY